MQYEACVAFKSYFDPAKFTASKKRLDKMSRRTDNRDVTVGWCKSTIPKRYRGMPCLYTVYRIRVKSDMYGRRARIFKQTLDEFYLIRVAPATSQLLLL